MLAQANDAIDEAAGAAGDTADSATEAASSGSGDFDIVDTLTNSAEDLIEIFTTWIPRIVLFVLILVIGRFVAKLIAKLVRKVLKKVNIDYYMDKAGIGGPLERAGFADSGAFVGKIVFYLIFLFVLKIAFDALGVLALNETLDELILWLPRLIVALILVVVGGIVANTVRDLVAGATSGQSYSATVTKIAFFAIWLIFGLAALNQVEVAADLVNTITETIFLSLGAILVLKFGIGGIWAARDRFWPKVYDTISGK